MNLTSWQHFYFMMLHFIFFRNTKESKHEQQQQQPSNQAATAKTLLINELIKKKKTVNGGSFNIVIPIRIKRNCHHSNNIPKIVTEHYWELLIKGGKRWVDSRVGRWFHKYTQQQCLTEINLLGRVLFSLLIFFFIVCDMESN